MNCLEPLSSEERLSQGDVIVWSEQSDCTERAGVVVTADCDLSKGKHWGRVTVVPLIPSPDYFDQIYLPRQLDNMEGDLLKLFGSAVRRAMGAADTDAPTPAVLDTLLGLDELPDPISKSDTAVGLHLVIRQARGIAVMASATHTFNQALKLREPKTQSLASEKIKAFLANPPGDCMILPAMARLDQVIHVAYLRIMREVCDGDIALKTSERHGNKGQRIGRLIPVVRYRLTQMLAQVFSDIGLPGPYEDELKKQRNAYLDKLQQTQERKV